MSEQQQHQATQHIVNARVIVEHMTELFKNKNDQEACIAMEALNLLPNLESNLSEKYSLGNPIFLPLIVNSSKLFKIEPCCFFEVVLSYSSTPAITSASKAASATDFVSGPI